MKISDAEVCRKNGWGPGTCLVGNEGYGDDVIQITAVGESTILAKKLSRDGVLIESPFEGTWTLECRDWKQCESPA